MRRKRSKKKSRRWSGAREKQYITASKTSIMIRESRVRATVKKTFPTFTRTAQNGLVLDELVEVSGEQDGVPSPDAARPRAESNLLELDQERHQGGDDASVYVLFSMCFSNLMLLMYMYHPCCEKSMNFLSMQEKCVP